MDGTVSASVTKEVTIELEKARMVHPDGQITTSLSRKDYKRWSWEACTKMSPAFLLPLPDHFGYTEDPHYQITMATYLGHPCPAMTPVVGHFFGKQGARLDK